MEARRQVLPSVLTPLGVLALGASFVLGVVVTGDAQSHCLAGYFLTAFVPATLGLLLLGAAASLRLRRWYLGCLSVPLVLAGCAVGGMLIVHLTVQRKLAVEKDAVAHRCAPLIEVLSRHHQAHGSFPPDLGTLAPQQVRACELEKGALDYAAGGGTYLLSVPASSIDVDGAVFFAGPKGAWTYLHNDLRMELEQSLTRGQAPATPTADSDDQERVLARYAALFVPVHPESTPQPAEPTPVEPVEPTTEGDQPGQTPGATPGVAGAAPLPGLGAVPGEKVLQPFRDEQVVPEEGSGVWSVPGLGGDEDEGADESLRPLAE